MPSSVSTSFTSVVITVASRLFATTEALRPVADAMPRSSTSFVDLMLGRCLLRTWLPNPMSEIPTLPSFLARGWTGMVRLRSGLPP